MVAQPFLIALTARGVGRCHHLGEKTLLGRHHDCDVQLLDPQVSKHHAQITRRTNGYELEDLSSRNGVLLNGSRIGVATLLRPNDLMALGDDTFIFSPAFEVLANDQGDAVLVVEDMDTTQPTNARQHGMAAALGGSTLSGLLEHLKANVPFHAAAVLTPRPLELVCLVAAEASHPVSRTLVQRAINERMAILVDDAMTHAFLAHGKSVVKGKVRAALVVPLILQESVVGVVYLTHSTPGAFTNLHVQHVVSAAPLIAVTLLQTTQHEALVQRLRCFEALAVPVLGEYASAVARVQETVRRAAAAPSSVLITGETGTGKELVARALHAQGAHPQGPFVAINCASLPEQLVEGELFGHVRGAFTGADRDRPGKLEQAQGGTLFLDEIGDLPASQQGKLLRVLEDKTLYRLGAVKPTRVDFRLVTATHRDLKGMVKSGVFREDLYYRICVIHIDNPPLRERLEDLPALMESILGSLCRELALPVPTVTADALAVMKSYTWPGNIRELRNALERALVLMEGSQITVAHLPLDLVARAHTSGKAPTLLPALVEALERNLIEEAMKRHRGKKVHAAAALGISRPTLDKKLKDYNIDVFGDKE